MDRQKVLVLDIETRPVEAYVWDLRDQNISLAQIIRDSGVIAWAAKWLGEKNVMYQDMRSSPYGSDKELVRPLWKLLDDADIVVTQNGKNFDCPRLNARFIEHGMKPPSPYEHLDTYQIVRRVSKFTSNKLEYLTDKLNVKYKKLDHKNFPGWSLWKECLNGNKAAWDEMRTYNIHDVLSTEELYLKIRAWAPKSAPSVFVDKEPTEQCGTCGGKVQRRGAMRSKAGQFQRLQCQGCGRWSKGDKIKAEKDGR